MSNRFDANVSVMTAQRRDKEDQAQKILNKTFSSWATHQLKSQGITITNLFTDLENGVNLIKLAEAIAKKKLEATLGQKYNQNPSIPIKKIDNVSLALQFLQKTMNINININPKDIVDGNAKVILGLIWRFVTTEMVAPEEGAVEMSAIQRNKQAKSNLLNWVKGQLKDYKDLQINDFETSFNDGMVFNALIHKFNPSLVNYSSLSRERSQENLALAFDLAEKHLGIPKLIEPSDLLSQPVDEKVVMTYLAEFPLAWIHHDEQRTREVTGLPLPPPLSVDDLPPPPPAIIPEIPAPLPLPVVQPLQVEELKAAFWREHPLPALPEQVNPSEREKQLFAEFQQHLQQSEQIRAQNAAILENNKRLEMENQARITGLQMGNQQDVLLQEQRSLQELIKQLQLENERMQKELLMYRGEVVGTVKVTVVEARSLRQKKKYGGGDFLDPFVGVKLGNQQHRTRVVMRTITPRWDQTFTLFAPNNNSSLEVTLWDWHVVTKAGFRGQAIIPLSSITSGQLVDKWFPLMGDKETNRHKGYGEIRLTIKYDKQ